MADFELSAGRTSDPPELPLDVGDLVMISQFRSGAWKTSVISLEELIAFVAGAIEISADSITSGVLPIARGGTGGTTDAEARANLSAARTDGPNTFNDQQNFNGQIVAAGGVEYPTGS